ncbi:alpha/beta hydrolase [Streptomyces sp. MST-110588]|uniref:alpha/beta hydrolase n=1 Tax=Streptomyces sp. MST-110588 TaxID=2833628 RepID=UPI001F5CFA21|nr:alpha/beta hydrolase [Streptomyces sp. MST-110588]UNO43005.1 alpha/beta hydrolase [Streptomyces sp. MST-110588]
MSYDFDPELAPFAPRMRPLDYAEPASARAVLRQVMAAQPGYEGASRVRVEDRTLPVADGPDLTVRIYRPAARGGPRPALIFPHWGAFVTGDLDTPQTFALRIADLVGAVVVSPDYRLAPEHPFPAGLEDCYAALEWTAGHAAELGVDTDRIGLAGFSAGGGLAAGTALLARDRNGPRVRYLYLLFPQLDDRLETPSARSFVDTPMLDRGCLELSWKHYLGGAPASPYAAPARATDLSGLPPAFVGTCEYDPLRDEGIIFAHRLVQAGRGTQMAHYPGTFHASVGIAHAAVSRRMVADQIDALRRGLGSRDA